MPELSKPWIVLRGGATMGKDITYCKTKSEAMELALVRSDCGVAHYVAMIVGKASRPSYKPPEPK